MTNSVIIYSYEDDVHEGLFLQEGREIASEAKQPPRSQTDWV